MTPLGPPPKATMEETLTPVDVDSTADQPATVEEPTALSTMPPPVTPSFARNTSPWEPVDNKPVDDEWKMSDLGPPPSKKRRTWLWIIVAILAFFVLACCGLLFWISATDAGSLWFNDLATQVSEQATEAAR